MRRNPGAKRRVPVFACALAVALAVAFLSVIPSGNLLLLLILPLILILRLRLPLPLPIIRRHPERSEGPLYWPLLLFFCPSFRAQRGTCSSRKARPSFAPLKDCHPERSKSRQRSTQLKDPKTSRVTQTLGTFPTTARHSAPNVKSTQCPSPPHPP